MTKKIISTDKAPKGSGPFTQAVSAGGLLFISGMFGLSPETGALVSPHIAVQTEQAMKNLGAILEAAGLGFQHVVKTTILLANLGEYGAVKEVYEKYFAVEAPARTTYEVEALPLNARVGIEAIAVVS